MLQQPLAWYVVKHVVDVPGIPESQFGMLRPCCTDQMAISIQPFTNGQLALPKPGIRLRALAAMCVSLV